MPDNDLAAHGVVTIANSAEALPGTVPGSAKVTPLDRFPAKGRATRGVRAHRFLRGEDVVQMAWVGELPARAIGMGGKPVELPAVDERRDGSGEQLKQWLGRSVNGSRAKILDSRNHDVSFGHSLKIEVFKDGDEF